MKLKDKIFSRSADIEKCAAYAYLTVLLLKCGYFNTSLYPVFNDNSILFSAVLAVILMVVLFFRSYSKKELYATAGFLVLSAIGIAVTRETFLALTLLAVLALKNQPVDKAIKWSLGVKAVMLTVLFSMTAVGLLENVQYEINKSGAYFVSPYAYGTAHPNQVGLFYAVIVFSVLCIMEKKNYNLKLLLLSLTTSFVFAVCQSRTMIITVILFLNLAFLMQFKPLERLISRLLSYTYLVIIALLSFVGFISPMLYAGDSRIVHAVLEPVNHMMNGRINIASMLVDRGWKPTLLGSTQQLPDLIGLDIAYNVLLYRFGIVFSIIMMAILAYSCHYFNKRKPLYSVCILITMLYGLFENLFYLPMVNITVIIAAGAVFRWWNDRPEISAEAVSRKLKGRA